MSRASILSLFFVAVLFVGIFSALAVVHAQTAVDPTTGQVDPLDLDTDPAYPSPYQNVTITPSSTVFDMAGSAIVVKVNGAVFYTGSGGQDIIVPVGGPGSATTISVTATSAGQTYTKQLVIHPADVALVTEAISSSHPFYQGGGLVASQGRVRLIAIPDLRTSAGKQLDPSTLTYTWKLGDQILNEDSGIGKNVLDATAPMRYRDVDVSLTVTNADGSLTAQADTTISPVDPLTLVYRDDPLLGPDFDTALPSTFNMPDSEETFLGVPYYFGGTPTLDWQVNGADSGTDPDLTVRSSGDGTGTANLSFAASQTDTLQTANSTVSVNFGVKQSRLFGL